jgi:hypothetical protein
LILQFACEKPEIPRNPFDDYKPTQGHRQIPFSDDPDSTSIAGLYTYIFKPTCANSGCHDGTSILISERWKVPTIRWYFVNPSKKDGKYLFRVKPYSLDSSGILARVNGIVTPQMPIQFRTRFGLGAREKTITSL